MLNINLALLCFCAFFVFPLLQEYVGSMPWTAVPFRDDQLRSVLSRKFKVGRQFHTVKSTTFKSQLRFLWSLS